MAQCRAQAEGQQLGVETLEDFFARTPRIAVALSGGCDSAYLLAAAKKAGCEVSAYAIKTAFQPENDLADAAALAQAYGAPFTVIEKEIFTYSDICANTDKRCYYCKRMMFEAIVLAAQNDGFEVVVDGTNASDDPARRPGFQALAEWGILSPLRRAGLTKEDIRSASRKLGLATADKKDFSCYAIYAPAHQPLTCDVVDAIRLRFER
ncbi:asparagine synthase-related protein [Adlercreutzia agrestimuris]|uniref:asparagine synthase-related protein n=1 Tax=Adlercreutzia agrestimuris TaxID=2941324 RepID=UPI0020413185|nr:asparagine synthase-related protein [Adlercreutzia agrestimuris]